MKCHALQAIQGREVALGQMKPKEVNKTPLATLRLIRRINLFMGSTGQFLGKQENWRHVIATFPCQPMSGYCWIQPL